MIARMRRIAPGLHRPLANDLANDLARGTGADNNDVKGF